jgi:predicted nuclease of predicted toxin-antitoxin system
MKAARDLSSARFAKQATTWSRLPKSGGATDEHVLEVALRENRVLITEDRDFGALVFAKRHPSMGVVLVKFHSRARLIKPATMVEAVAKLGSRLQNVFVVVEPGRVRVRTRLP